MVGLVRFDNLWGYAVEPLIPDRPKVRFHTKRNTGVYAVGGWSRFAYETRLLIRRACASQSRTPPFKKRLNWTPSQGRGPISGQLSVRAAGTDTVDLAPEATEAAAPLAQKKTHGWTCRWVGDHLSLIPPSRTTLKTVVINRSLTVVTV